MVLDVKLFVNATTFLTGFVFFGDPVLSRATAMLQRMVPDWKEFFDIRK